MRARLLFLIVSLVSLVGCDHATKHWAETALRAAPPVEIVPGMLDLSYAQNPGVAFNLLRWLTPSIRAPLVVAMGIVAVAMLIVLLLRKHRAKRVERAAYALLLGGALGNVIDRIARGYVVDFIHLHHWPVFNVADMLIVAGIALLLLAHWRTGPDPPPRAQQGAG